MFKTLTTFWVMTFTLVLSQAKAQIQPLSYVLPSPNASSLGTFGEVPVSYYTGLPQISEELYTITGKRLKMPMTLDYHAQGIRPDLHPGWVGSGWNLTIGGAITRIPRHGLDEYNNQQFGGLGYYFQYGYLNNASWSATSTLQKYPINDPTTEPDEEADEFDFNFMGYTGKFFLDQTGAWRVQCDKPLKVVFNSSDFIMPFVSNSYGEAQLMSKAFKKFTIIDEKGNQYIFGGPETAIEYSDNFTGTGELLTATSWYLTQVISADGSETMNLTYQRGPFVANISPYSVTTGDLASGGSTSFFSLNDWTCSNGSTSYGYSATWMSTCYLSTVTFPNKDIMITFNTSKSNDMVYTLLQYQKCGPSVPSGLIESSNILNIPYFQANYMPPGQPQNFVIWLKLNSINIGNMEGTRTYRTVNFSYRENSTSRLSLNDMYLADGEGNQVQHYHFDYNYATPLPAYLGCLDDHWGFYNGSTLTEDYNNVGSFPTDRAPNATYAQAEMLTKITYPTGGFTSFNYQLNDYSQAVRRDRSGLDSYVGVGGGLRVGSITSDDGTGNTVTKTLYYVNGYTPGVNPTTLPSSGILNAEPQYTFETTGTTFGGQAFWYYLLTSIPAIPLTVNSDGIIVGYSTVVEVRSDNSYTVYTFTNHDNGYMDQLPVNTYNETDASYVPTTSLSFERGRPLTVTQYDNNGVIVHQTSTTYAVNGNPSTDYSRAEYWSVLNICSGVNAGAQVVVRSAYTLPYYSLLPSSDAEYTYNGGVNNYVGVQKNYSRDTHKLINSISFVNSKGLTDFTTITHPADYTTAPYTNMVSLNMLDFEVNKQELVNSVLQEVDVTNYNAWSASVITPQTIQRQLLSQPIQTVTQYYNYDGNGNPLEFTNANNSRLSYIWDYNYEFPIAEAKNAHYSDIAYTSFETTGTGGWSGINSLYIYGNQFCVTGTHYYYQSGFSLSKGSLSSINTYIVSYWSQNGSYSVNGTSGTAGRSINGWTYYSHTVTPSTGTVTVTGSGAIDELRLYPVTALMTTYTFDPANGMTSRGDENNRISYYNYDAFSRLNLVRDQDYNILKKYCYTYNSQTENCNIEGNDAMSSTLTNQNCGQQYWPGQATYNVAAGTYYGSTSTAADVLARNDLNANAQNYANQNGPCTYLNFYVRIEFTQNYNYSDAYTTEVSTDPVVRFYANAACTIPFTIPDGMNPNLNTLYQTTDQIPSTGYNYATSYPSPVPMYSGTNEYDEGFMDTYYSTDSGYDIETETFSLVAGQYYTIEPSVTVNN